MKNTSLVCILLSVIVFFPHLLSAQWTQFGTPTAHTSVKPYNKIVFPTASVGYAVVGNNEISKTTDGGLTWTNVYRAYQVTGADIYSINNLHFTTADVGYAVGSDFFSISYIILKTTNGGSTWTPYSYQFANNVGEVRAIDFPTPSIGYAVGDFGLFFKTTNAGTTWQESNLPQNTDLAALDFTDVNNGFVLSYTGQLSKTTNGGSSWQTLTTPTAFRAIHFITSSRGYASSVLGVHKTINGGQSWLLIGSLIGASSLHFIDEQNGYAVAGGRIWHTTDSGQNWLLQQVVANVTQDQIPFIQDFCFVNQNLAFASGYLYGDGTSPPLVAKTTNGGGAGANFSLSATVFTCPHTRPLVAMPKFSETPTLVEWFIDTTLVSNAATDVTLPLPVLSPISQHTVKLKAHFNQTIIELEEDIDVQNVPDYNSPRLTWTPPCQGFPFRIYVSTFAQEFPHQLVDENNQVVAGPKMMDQNGSLTNYFDLSGITTTQKYTVQIVHICGIKVGDTITVEPLITPRRTLAVTPSSDRLLCKAGNEITIKIAQSEPDAFYRLYQNNVFVGNGKSGTGEDLFYPTNSFDSTTVFSVTTSRYFRECTVPMNDTIKIEVERPKAVFGTNGLNLIKNTPVSVNFAGKEALTFNWRFGQSATPMTSTNEQPPSVIYSDTTTQAEIRLIVTAPLGCKDTTYKRVGFYSTANLSLYWAQSASIIWELDIFGKNTDVDKDGNMVVVGFNEGPVNVPSKAGITDYLYDNERGLPLLKYDKYGVLQWAVPMYGDHNESKGVVIDNAKNTIVIVNSTPFFSANNYLVVGSTDAKTRRLKYRYNSAIVKYAPNGKLEWLTEFNRGIPNSSTNPNLYSSYNTLKDVQTDSLGNIYLLGSHYTYAPQPMRMLYGDGTFSDLTGTHASYVMKLSPNGKLIWDKPLPNSTTRFGGNYRNLKLDASKNIYVTGDDDVLLTKLDSLGDLQWRLNPLTSSSFLGAGNLDFDEQGNVFVAGDFTGTLNFAGFPPMTHNGATVNSITNKALFLAKINPQGQPIWVKNGFSSLTYEANTAVQYYQGSVYFSGTSIGSFRYNNTPITNDPNLSVPLIVKVNASDGTYQMHLAQNRRNPASANFGYAATIGRSLRVTNQGIHWIGRIGYEAKFGNTILNQGLEMFIAKIPSLDTNTTIPVELLRFQAQAVEKVNVLKWATASEINNKGYDILRAGSDLRFQKIGFVNGKNKAADYDFTDADPLSISYYKLRQIDVNGKETDSKTVSVIRTEDGDITLFPNPTNGKVYIKSSKFQPDYVRVVNNLGQTVIESATQNNNEIDMSHLPNGIYAIELSSKSKKIQKTIVKN